MCNCHFKWEHPNESIRAGALNLVSFDIKMYFDVFKDSTI